MRTPAPMRDHCSEAATRRCVLRYTSSSTCGSNHQRAQTDVCTLRQGPLQSRAFGAVAAHQQRCVQHRAPLCAPRSVIRASPGLTRAHLDHPARHAGQQRQVPVPPLPLVPRGPRACSGAVAARTRLYWLRLLCTQLPARVFVVKANGLEWSSCLCLRVLLGAAIQAGTTTGVAA